MSTSNGSNTSATVASALDVAPAISQAVLSCASSGAEEDTAEERCSASQDPNPCQETVTPLCDSSERRMAYRRPFSANWVAVRGGIRRALQPKSPLLHRKNEQVRRSSYSTLHTFLSSEPVGMGGVRQTGCLKTCKPGRVGSCASVAVLEGVEYEEL